MGDYSDFVESYGYEANNPDAFDNIMSQWARDEKLAEKEAKYSQNVQNAKNKPDEKFAEITKIGFSNFMPFGEKIQSFSKKPITLIYGPNSIGKSSLIKMNSYMKYINTSKTLDLLNTDMFGDNIDLGGFSNFIHKKNKENMLTLEYEFEDCSKAIIKYLNLKESYSQNIINALSLFSENDIKNIIQNFKKYIFESFEGALLDINYKEVVFPDRSENKKLYLDEIQNTSSKYIFSREYPIHDFFHKEVVKIKTLLDIDSFNFIGENGKFNDKNTRNLFISDVLIPFFINKEKDSCSFKDFSQLSIKVFKSIKNQIEEHNYLKQLKNSKIPLKISCMLQHHEKIDFINIRKVKYYVDNVLFSEISGKFDYINEEYSYSQENLFLIDEVFAQQLGLVVDEIPNVFKNMPEELNNKIFYFTNDDIKFMETKKSPLFWSHKEGYDQLIGVFNDMIQFKAMQYIGPLRFYPNRNVFFKEIDSDESIIPNSEKSWSYLKKDKKLLEKINIWLKDESKLKTSYEIQYRKLYDMKQITDKIKDMSYSQLIDKYVEKDIIDNIVDFDISYVDDNMSIHTKDNELLFVALLKNLSNVSDFSEKLIFKDLTNNTQINNKDLGLGISQILPILIATNRQKNMTIAIEQPELHLHPAVQMEIADEFIKSYKENNNEFIIETHSEHLLLRIMKRMRHTAEDRQDRDKTLDLTPDDICLLYIDSDRDERYIQELRLSADGKLLDAWPNGFFEEGFKERFS